MNVEGGYRVADVSEVLANMADAGGGEWNDEADDMVFTPREVEVCSDQFNSRGDE